MTGGGDVAGARVRLPDDLIARGVALLRAGAARRRAGAHERIAFAAHGLLTGTAARLLDDRSPARVVVSASVLRVASGWRRRGRRPRVQMVPAAPLLAQAVRDSHVAWLR